MKKYICYIVFLYILLIILFSTSCRTTKNQNNSKSDKLKNTTTATTNNNTKSKTSDFTKKYSELLGVTLTGKEDKKLIEELAKWLGTPYVYGGTSLKGTDCSGFVQSVYKIVYNINLYRSAADLVKNGELIDKKKLETGDLVFFKINSNKVSHVGIYINEGKFIHASSSKGVIVSKLSNTYYTKYFYSGGRIKNTK